MVVVELQQQIGDAWRQTWLNFHDIKIDFFIENKEA
jgi:hypothetical protein